jgi:hypothetical protein
VQHLIPGRLQCDTTCPDTAASCTTTQATPARCITRSTPRTAAGRARAPASTWNGRQRINATSSAASTPTPATPARPPVCTLTASGPRRWPART